MNSINKRIEIDLYSPTSYEIVKAQQGDNNSRIIEFVLYNNGEPYMISDEILITLQGHRGDHSSFIKENYCTVTNNVINVILDSDILSQPGTVEAKIVMDSDGMILSTIPFKIYVQQDPCNKNNLSEKETSIYDALKKELDGNTTEFFVEKNGTIPDLRQGDYYLKEY